MTPKQIIWRIALIVFLVEGAAMLCLHFFDPLPYPGVEAVVDGLALVLIASPIIVRLVVLPYVRARDQAEQRLSQANRANTLLLESTDDGVFGVDPEGRIAFINPAAARMVGWAGG